MEKEITIKFPNAEAARVFMSWMSEQGEQDMDYWFEENYKGPRLLGPEYTKWWEPGKHIITFKEEHADGHE